MTQYQKSQLDALKWRRDYHIAQAHNFRALKASCNDESRKPRLQRRVHGHVEESERYQAKYQRHLKTIFKV
jgi:hypothetical protein